MSEAIEVEATSPTGDDWAPYAKGIISVPVEPHRCNLPPLTTLRLPDLDAGTIWACGECGVHFILKSVYHPVLQRYITKWFWISQRQSQRIQRKRAKQALLIEKSLQ